MLHILKNTQQAEGPHEARRGPCLTICAAAGLQGKERQWDRCNQIRNASISLLSERGVPQTTLEFIAHGITAANIQATAEHVLRVPELLTVPAGIEEYLGGIDPRHLERSGGLAQTILCMCFVVTNKFKFTYFDNWDSDEGCQRQVRSPASHQLCS